VAWQAEIVQVFVKGKEAVMGGKKVGLTACETNLLQAVSAHGPSYESLKTER
jgi:hypothetical protein